MRQLSCCSLRLSWFWLVLFNFVIRSTFSQDAQFICYSSNECRGNALSGIGVVEDCCVAGGGLSYRTGTLGQCNNCYDQQSFTTEGSQFIFGIFDNHQPQGPFEINLLRIAVDPVDSSRPSFTVESLGKTTQYTGPQEISLKANEVQLNDPKSRDRAIQIRSLNGGQLSVVAYSEEFVSSDSLKILPCIRLPSVGYEYYAVSVVQSQIEFQLFNTPNFVLPPEGKSAIVIVTTESNTVLDITLTQDIFVGEANDLMDQIGGDTIRAGETVTISFPEAMQTLYLASNDDLTGSRVVSNRPISFTSGHECGTLPNTMLYCDQMVDQIPPTSTWGKTFIVASLDSRSSNDSVKIVASRNDTTIRVRCSRSSSPFDLSISEAGDSIETLLISDDSCYFESNNPVLLVQFSRSSLLDGNLNSDPFMVVIPPVEQYRSNYIIRTFATSDPNSPPGLHYLNILLPGAYNPALVYVDGQPIIEGATVQSILCDVELETICAYTLQLQISEATHTLSHADPSARLNAVVYWYSFRVGQGYFAGMMQQPIALPIVTLEALNNFANESSGEANLLLRRSGDIDLEATVVLETSNIQPLPNPAAAGQDFEAVKMDVTFLSGVTEVMVSVPLLDDVFPEQEFENFEIALSASPGVLIGSPSFVNFTIVDDDPPLPVVNVSVESSTLTTSELAGSVEVRLLKTDNAIGPVTVLVSTVDGTAQTGDSDYVRFGRFITFQVDELEKTVSITINADLKIEDPEDFFVVLTPSNNIEQPFPVRVNPEEGTTTITIEDEDVAVIGFARSFYEIAEGSEGSVQVSLLLNGRQLQRTISVMVFSMDGTATGGTDYDNVSGIVEFSPNRTLTATIPVSVLADLAVEPPEIFSLRLGLMESSSVILSPSETVVSIIDRDGPAIISLEPLRPLVREGDGSARVNITLRGASHPLADVSITTSSLTATRGEDYSDPLVTQIRLSEVNSFEEVLIPILDDRLFEGPIDEQFMVRISLPSCSTPGGLIVENAEAIVSIQDNDIRPVASVGFSSSSYSGVEGTEINLLVEGDGRNQQPLTVQYSILRTGTAAIGIDVVVSTFDTLTLPAGGPSTASIPVSLVDDTIAEASEWFLVSLSVGSDEGETIAGMGTANITILDNDRVVFGLMTTEYSVAEGQGSLAVNVLKLTESSQAASVRFSTRDVLVGDSASHIARDEVLTFQPGETSRTVLITLVDDDIVGESVEVFNIRLTAVPGQALDTAVQDGLAQVIVSDDDEDPIDPSSAVLQFSESDYSAIEGGEGTVCLLLVSLTGGQLIENAVLGFETVTVGSQVPPNTLSQTVNLTLSLVGEAVYCETLTSVDDFLVAGDVQLVFTAFAIVNEPDTVSFSPGGDQANLTFIDDDVFIVTWETQSYSTNEGGRLEVCLIRPEGSFGPGLVTPALFNINTASLEAQAGLDYEGLITVLTFEPQPRRRRQTLGPRVCALISTIDDDVLEGEECFSVLAAPQEDGRNIRVIRGNATVCITDNDFHTGTIGFSQSNYTAVEGGEPVLVCIVLLSQTGPLTGSAFIGFSTVQDTFEGFRASGAVNFEGAIVGDPLLCQNFTVQDDDIPEPDQVSLLSAFIEGPPTINFAPGGDQATVTVIDNDDPRTVAVLEFAESDYTAVEGDNSTICIDLVSISGSLIENAVVGFTFTGVPGEPTTLSQVVDLTLSLVGESIFCEILGFSDESIVNGDLQFLLTAFATVNEPDIIRFSPGGDQANITRLDNDEFIVMWETQSYSTSEGSQLEVCLIRGEPLGPTLEASALFRINTVSLEAQAGLDYGELDAVLTYDPQRGVVCALISITDDDVPEGEECFSLLAVPLGDERNIRVINGNATVCITDNDFHTGMIGFSQSNYTAVEGGEPVLVCIVLLSQTGPLTGSAFIGFSTVQDTFEGFRASGAVNFEGAIVGDPLLCQNFTVQEDDIPEPDQVSLLSAFIEGPLTINFAPGGDQATVTVIDNDASGTIGFSQSNYTAVEGGEPVLVCIVLLSQTGPLTGSAFIGFSTSLEGFRASGGVDFEGAMVGDPLLCQNFTVQEDDIPEPDQVSLLSAFIEGPPTINFAPGGDQATVTVIDNDASATIGFSQANYTVIEGGDPVLVCLVVVSITGQPTETIFVGLSAGGIDSTVGEFNFEGAQVGDLILCQDLTFGDDNVVDQVPGAVLSAFIEATPLIVFAPERDTAILTFVDNDPEIVIGWESFSYTAFEGDQGSEQFCLLVENDKVLARPASLNILVDIESTTAQFGVDFSVSPELVFAANSSRACANVTIFTDLLIEEIECFTLLASAGEDARINVRGERTTVCIVDIPPPITAECLLNQTRGISPSLVSCTTANVPPDSQIEFITCEIDGTASDICAYPSFTINTDTFEPGPHTLVLVLRVGFSTLRLVPDLVFEGTAPPATTPPPRPGEPFLVSCNIDANSAEAFVFCAATVGDSRVNVDSCVLDFNPEALPSELCTFPSFSFPISELEFGNHTLVMTFSDVNNPDSIIVETLPFDLLPS